MPAKSKCRNCRYWEKGQCYPRQSDWGLCRNKVLYKELSINSTRVGTFEEFGCVHYEKRILVKM